MMSLMVTCGYDTITETIPRKSWTGQEKAVYAWVEDASHVSKGGGITQCMQDHEAMEGISIA